MLESTTKNFQTVICGRESIKLNGVLSVDGFGEDYILLNTSLGELTIEGSDLKIENLTKETGEVFVVGKISALFYKDDKIVKGFFKKIFK